MMVLPEELLDRIGDHARREYPEECCGVLFGRATNDDHTVEDIAEIENIQQENRKRRFLISADQYREAERLAAHRKMELIGFYHSHPDHPAVPSAFDTEHALPWFSYVIVAVVRGNVRDASAWVLADNRTRFEEQLLSVVPSPVHVENGTKKIMRSPLINE